MIFYIEFAIKFNFLVLKVFLGFFYDLIFPWKFGKIVIFAVSFFLLSFITVMVLVLILVGNLGM